MSTPQPRFFPPGRNVPLAKKLAAHIKIPPKQRLLCTHGGKSVVLEDLVLEAGVVLRNEVLRVKLLTILFVQLAHLLEMQQDGASEERNGSIAMNCYCAQGCPPVPVLEEGHNNIKTQRLQRL